MRANLWKGFVVAAVITAVVGVNSATAIEITDDFSSQSASWLTVTSGANVVVGVSDGKMVADFMGIPQYGGIAPGIGGALYASAFLDTTEVRSVVELDGDANYFYAGLVARGDQNLGYDPNLQAVTGNAYVITISGYNDNGDLQLHRISGNEQHHLGDILSFDGLGDRIDNDPMYLKLTVETVAGGVQLKGKVSWTSDFTDVFGQIEYLDTDPAKITAAGMVGVMGSNDPDRNPNPATAYFDDFYAADFIDTTVPGDCNGDGYVNSTDLDVVRAHWGQSVSGAANGDLSGDGVVNSSDLDQVRGNWGATPGAAVIPEPSVFVLLSLTGLLFVWKRR